MPALQFLVASREKGHTIASVIKLRFGLSWARAKRLIEGRHVRIGGQVEADPARRVRPGIRVEVAAGAVEITDQEPGNGDRPKTGRGGGKDKPIGKAKSVDKVRMEKTARPPIQGPRTSIPTPSFEIVYSDDAVVVVDKPAGLTTMRHVGEAEEFGPRGKSFLPKTLADFLPAALGAPGLPVIAVHRLDRDTSGLVVFARTRTAEAHLTDQFRKHTVDRQYLALVRGRPNAKKIDSTLVTDRGDGRRGTGSGPGGKRAVTRVKVVEELGPYAAVECRLETGRTHQVRIHLGEANAPLCGERIYDRPVNGKPAPDGSGAARPMLHAARLGFVHPESGALMTWDAKPPADFAEIWVQLRKNAFHQNAD
ncbi:MAG TPA: pseudouridine synthase [Fimbriiglobus sp.]|jgi:23S rRNA pseudouridine1911/1915/1917 synthase